MKKKQSNSLSTDNASLTSTAVEVVLSIIPEAVIILQERKVTYISDKAMEIFGITNAKDILGKSTRILYFTDEDFEVAGEILYRQIQEQGYSSGVVNVKRLSDGSPLQLAASCKTLDGTASNIVSVFKENTSSTFGPAEVYQPALVDFERKASEFSQILDSLKMAVLTMTPDGTIDYTNTMMNEIIASYPRGVGTKCYEACEHIWSENRNDFCSWCGIHDVMENGVASDKIVKGKDGKQWLFNWAPIASENDTINKVVKTVTDISSQMHEKKYLENLLHDIFSAMPTGIVIFNGVGQIIYMNSAMEERWGLNYSQVAMADLVGLEIYPDNRALSQAFSDLNFGKQTKNFELEVERHDGRKYWVTTSFVPLKKERDGWQGILLEEDLTKLSRDKQQVEKNLANRESMLIEQDKLAAVGQLAAGIAHELNTPTTYVRGNMQTFGKYTEIMDNLLSRLQDEDIPSPEKEAAFTKLTQIIGNMKEIALSSFEGTSRLINIISSMKTFVRQSKDDNRRINIYEPIKDALVLVFNRLKHVGGASVNGKTFLPGAEIDKLLTSFTVTGSAMRLSQLFIILFNDTIDAWQENHDKKEDSAPLKLELAVVTENTNLTIRICDNAGGIPDDVQEKIFEPFYTTKAVNVGTGLGLSIARQIAAEHNGKLYLENEPGVGACFVLEIGTQDKA